METEQDVTWQQDGDKLIGIMEMEVEEGEPFEMWGADWEGEVIPNLEVSQLRKNQKLFDYRPRVVVK